MSFSIEAGLISSEQTRPLFGAALFVLRADLYTSPEPGQPSSQARVPGGRVALVDGVAKSKQVAVGGQQEKLALAVVLVSWAVNVARGQAGRAWA